MEGLAAAEIETSNKRFGSFSGEEFPHSKERKLYQSAQIATQEASTTRAKKSGGPTTKRGRERSRCNALKHGIFASVVVLEDESPAQFDSLLQGFRDDLRPEGMMEEVLVEKLATLKWRHRRMLAAERAEIQMQQIDSSRTDQREKQQWDEAIKLWAARKTPWLGLLARCDNPLILKKCLELLESLKCSIEEGCYDISLEGVIERLLFDELTVSPLVLLLDTRTDFMSGRWDEVQKYVTPLRERKATVLRYLNSKMAYLKFKSDWNKESSELRGDLELECCGVPEAPRLDRLLRYSSSLERDFDRTLNQLERLQRTRKGQAVPPTLNVNVST